MSDGDLFYAWTRLILNVVHLACWVWILRLSIPLAKRAQTTDQRLFVAAIVFVLLVVSGLLALSTFSDPFRKPNPVPLLAMIGVALPTVLSIAGVVIIWKWPWRGRT